VFPILSMKALSLVNMKDKDIAKARKHGLAYTGGVMLSFAVIAGILIALKTAGAEIGWGFQLQNPLMILILAYLLFIIGLNLSGFFELGGRLANLGSSLASKGGYTGSFFTGILATIVATPCTAPFMGVAMGFALTLPAPAALGIFLAMGLGLALPYLLLTFVPAIRHLLPHPGHWMETFRQFLAFPMFASAAWLIWVLAQQADVMAVFSALLGMIAIAFIIWLYKVEATSRKGRIATIVLAIAMMGFIGSTFIIPHPGGMQKPSPEQALADQNWEDFTQARLDEMLKEGHPVFVNMTAAWCITCKVNEKVALSTDNTRALFADKGIKYLKGDWTNQNPEITKYLAGHGRSGVPIYVYYAPPNEESGERPDPVLLPQILTPGIVKDTIFQTP
jgi:thiol:disulfide interchange protein DsbD